MLFIVSPAKKMADASDAFAWRDLPRFLPQARELLGALRDMSYEELKGLWACSDALAQLNSDRVQHMDLGESAENGASRIGGNADDTKPLEAGAETEGATRNVLPGWQRFLTPAIFSYEGIQYQNMAPQVMTAEQLEYVQAHLRILSGFYGVLCPFDGVTPYRLEMQAKLTMPCGADGEPARNLYEFWGSRIYDALCEDLGDPASQDAHAVAGAESGVSSTDAKISVESLAQGDCAIVNLASVEYAKAVEPYAKAALKARAANAESRGAMALASGAGRQNGAASIAPRYVTCFFGSMKNGKFAQRATEAKAARGTFVRWCAENAIEHVSDFPRFDVGGYRFDEERSTEDVFVFVR